MRKKKSSFKNSNPYGEGGKEEEWPYGGVVVRNDKQKTCKFKKYKPLSLLLLLFRIPKISESQ